MKRRIYSDTFIDKRIAAVDAMHERTNVIINTPNVYDKLTDLERKSLDNYIKLLRDKMYVSGFWDGWVLRDGVKDE